MDIENMQNQLFSERGEEFLKEFNMKKDDYEQCIFKDLEELLKEKSAEYIVISPLYSSFVTQSYEYRLGIYGKDLYLRILGVDDEKIVYNTGMQLLGKLYELRCGREEYITQVQIEDRRINIIDTPYYIKNKANNRYADIDKLFAEIL